MTAKRKIVVVEDEADILDAISHNLTREGYRVIGCGDGLEGLKRIRAENPDLVLLDLMLPGLDGLEVCRRLKADETTRHIPIVMVTAKAEESDIVIGLSLGADDYVVKPFRMKELLARVRAVLNRGLAWDEAAPSERLARGGFVIDASRFEVKVGGAPVTLSATEFRLLHFLASHPERAFTRNQLLSRTIGENAMVIDRNIDVHVQAIRRKLGERRDLIETVRGVGYRFLNAAVGE